MPFIWANAIWIRVLLISATWHERVKADVKYDSGEIWDGDAALEIGLIDEICTLEKLVDSEGGQIKEFGPGAKTYTPFSFNFADDIAKAITQVFWRQRADEAPLKF